MGRASSQLGGTQGSSRDGVVLDQGDLGRPSAGRSCSPLALSALSRQIARLRLAPTSSTRGAMPSCTREGKRRSTGRGTAGGSVWKKSSASSRASCRRQTQAKETPPSPRHPSPLLPVPPHLSQSWGTCSQVSGVLVPHGRQPAAVSLLQEAFSAECSGCVAAQTTLILQHKRVLGAEAQEAAQQPAKPEQGHR